MIHKPPFVDPEQRIFTLSDVIQIFTKQKKRLIQMTLLGGALVFLGGSLKPVHYRIEASFKEELEKSTSEGALLGMLNGVNVLSQQPQAATFMRSYQVLKPLIEKVGLQAEVPSSNWFLAKIEQRIRENVLAEQGKSLEDIDTFRFSPVIYEGELSLHYALFVDPQKEEVAIYTPDQKKLLAKGKKGEILHVEEVQLAVQKWPKHVRRAGFYPLEIKSWLKEAKKLRSQFQITNDKTNKSIYQLALLHRDRHLGQQLVNELMLQYQFYLKRAHDQLAQDQLVYLQQRQAQLYGTMEGMLDEHVAYLKETLGDKGFLGLEESMQGVFLPYQDMMNQIRKIDLELGLLEQLKSEREPVALSVNSQLSPNVSQILQTINGFKQQKDLLELSLQQHQTLQEKELSFDTKSYELRQIRSQRNSVRQILDVVEGKGHFPSFSFDVNRALGLWASRIQESQNIEERKDLSNYLSNYNHLLSVRENMLQERTFHGDTVPKELEGIDLETARTLFVEYNTKLDLAEANRNYYEQLLEQIPKSTFELSSLSTLLTDPLSQSLIQKATQILLQLKEEKYHSSKEGKRWEEELDLQRRLLRDHLEQLYRVEELNVSLIRRKILGLQQVSLDCINRNLSVLHEQARDTLKERQEALLLEKKLLETKMEEMRHVAQELPEKWRQEKWINLKTEMASKMVKTLTELVESKTIGHHLHHVQSKPLDFAVLPPIPYSPRLFMMSCVGALGAFLFAFIRKLAQAVSKGVPTSLEKLQLLQYPVAGTISSFCDGPAVEIPMGEDLELLRQCALFLEKAPSEKVIGLIEGKGPDYSYALAQNLARMSYRSLVLRFDFHAVRKEAESPGILQYWKQTVQTPIIHKQEGFDWVGAGGYSPFGAEILQTPSIRHYVQSVQKEYDWIFILVRSPLESAESLAALSLCDRAFVTVRGEKIEQLTPFVQWAYHDGKCRLKFVGSER